MAPRWKVSTLTALWALSLLGCCNFGCCKKTTRTSGSERGGTGGETGGGSEGGREEGRAGGGEGGGSEEEQGLMSHERVKRGWVWNQFFVVEEYTGTEPLYVGKQCHLWVSHTGFNEGILALSVLPHSTQHTAPEPVSQIHTDSDEGEGTITYTISGEGAGTIFIIDELTGDIHATERLDREEKAFYTLRAQARDRPSDDLLEPESEFVIKVQDINDSEPKFLEGPYIGSVAELSPIGRVEEAWREGSGR
ncbi:hypothetical protein NHX12_030754 [Muraenolepis orangiensis]|uniref:Cadherin domain-containing protein n=1 Tax=Muraenolepis orangiensis TaxID=630683 RepID=A0A9Q0ILY2_9TELE|nr:hypothetical protein NHX12_030754 [Muraenolepis orangiensis]